MRRQLHITIDPVNILGVAAALALAYYSFKFVVRKYPVRLGPLQEPERLVLTPVSAPVKGPIARIPPRLMTAPELTLLPGNRYGVALDTPKLLPTSDSAVKKKATELGFTNVDVWDEPPPGWPGMKESKADTYVVGFYVGPPKKFPRVTDTTMGSIDVIEAWEG